MYTESMEDIKKLKEAFEEQNRLVCLILNKQLDLIRALKLSIMQKAEDYLENVKRLADSKNEIEDFIARFNEYLEKRNS